MAEDRVTLNLRVLSPSSEVDGGIHLQDLPISTTVRELRLKIQDAVASKPGPERMRLIYRGKVVANDADTLEAVFGTENVGHAVQHWIQIRPLASELTDRPASRVQGPEPAPGYTRTAAGLLDVVHARPAHSECPARPFPACSSWPSAPDEPIPRHTTAPSQLAATGRPATAAAPSPPPSPTSSACTPSPPCAAGPQPSGSPGRHATPAPDAAAARPGHGAASASCYSTSRHASSRHTRTAR